MTYCSKFGTLGNERHLPSLDKCGTRFVLRTPFVPAVAGLPVVFIETSLLDTTAGSRDKIIASGIATKAGISSGWLGSSVGRAED